MKMSDQIDQLATALSLAQAEIEDAEKSRANPAFRSRYADLGAVVDACKPALTKHGLSFAQAFEPSEPGVLVLTTILMHKSGQWLSGTCAMPLTKVDAQGYGSCATYARRYGLAAMVGVCPEDDDGNAATQRPQSNSGRQEFNRDEPVTLPAVQRAERGPLMPNGSPWEQVTPPLVEDVPCSKCFAPVGKPHLRKCPTLTQPSEPVGNAYGRGA